MKVSVIIPIYNAEKYIGQCAQSLFSQTQRDIEYIFVNDASTDASLLVLGDVLSAFPERKEQTIILDNEINKGPSFTRNRGLDISSGDYIAFCDADDFVHPHAYERMLKAAISSQAEMVACGVLVNDGKTELLFDKNFSLCFSKKVDCQEIEGALYSSLWNKLIRRDLFVNNHIRFNDNLWMWDDLYVVFQLRYYCKRDIIINEPLYQYVANNASITHSNRFTKSQSQIKCSELLELFFSDKVDRLRYRHILSFLKFHSKNLLFTNEYIHIWLSCFPETHRDILLFRQFYGYARIIRYLIVIVLKESGWKLLNRYSSIKKFIIKK